MCFQKKVSGLVLEMDRTGTDLTAGGFFGVTKGRILTVSRIPGLESYQFPRHYSELMYTSKVPLYQILNYVGTHTVSPTNQTAGASELAGR